MADPSVPPRRQLQSQETTQSLESPGVVHLPQGVMTILVLFLFLRLTILFLYTPQGLLNSFTDYDFYYRTAQLSDQGYYPYVNMWYEYPPFLAYLPQLAYEITRVILPSTLFEAFGFNFFSRVLGSILLLFDAGVLILLYRLGDQVWGKAAAHWVSWVYLSLSLPMFFWSYSHQVVPVFFLLLAMDLFLSKRYTTSAIALGSGIAAKLTPILFLVVVLKFLWPNWKRIILYGLTSIGVFVVFFLPFWLMGGSEWIVASFKAWANVGSWRTVWALIDGNWGPGYYGPLETRLQIQEAVAAQANPAVVPGWVSLAVFGLLVVWYMRKPGRGTAGANLVWFTTIITLLFLLWSKGWSPQWAVMLIPLLLLSFPGKLGLVFVLGLSGLTFLEWPLLEILESQVLFAIHIVIRTGFFVYILYVLTRRLWSADALILVRQA
ncbi:MAG TPA: hypothetical protein VLM80_00860 [Anaerolineales bacterium]|nr:hypothetical protein [Anaerolineales bacterium]